MNTASVLKAIVVPRTKREISELTGMTEPQITQAFRYINRRGGKYHTIGVGAHTHYYLPKYEQVGLGEKFIYQQILDLIDTDEWWSISEICDVFDLDSKEVGNKLRYIKRTGRAEISMRRNWDGEYQYFVNKRG
ncbi:hypothetical protein VPH159E362A_0052 [Vibrio phage 159E36-2a]